MNRHLDQRSRDSSSKQTWRMLRRGGWGLLGLAIAISAGCANKPPLANPPPPRLQDLPVNTLAAAWRAELPVNRARLSRLMVDDQNVYAYSNDQQCFWMKRSGGQLMSIAQIGAGRRHSL